MPTFDTLAPVENAVALFRRSDDPTTTPLAKKIGQVAWLYNLTAHGVSVNDDVELAADERNSLSALNSFAKFLRESFDETKHTAAFERIFTELKGSAECVATQLLVAHQELSPQVRSLLKQVVIDQGGFNHGINGFISWSYRVCPAKLDEGINSCGYGKSAQNELALVIGELRYNQTHSSDDYRFLKILLDNCVDFPTYTETRYRKDIGERTQVSFDRSPETMINWLKVRYPEYQSAITRGYDIWRGWNITPQIPTSHTKSITHMPEKEVESPQAVFDKLKKEGLLRNLPLSLVSTDSLSGDAIDATLDLARSIGEARGKQWASRGPEPKPLFSEFAQLKAASFFDQPSTRSIAAVRDAMQILGLQFQEFSGSESSRSKGESPLSERVTLIAQGFSVVCERPPGVENRFQELESNTTLAPLVQINMGGNIHHPTQTLADLLTIMEICECYGLEALKNLKEADQSPPTIMFYGRFSQKRADRALAEFASKRLGWNCVLVAPYREDIPSEPDSPISRAFIHSDKSDQDGLSSLIKDCNPRFIYMSNAEATAETGKNGTGQGKLEAATFMNLETLLNSKAHLLHPLPAGGELAAEIWGHERFAAQSQITNKVFSIAAITAMMLAARAERIRS